MQACCPVVSARQTLTVEQNVLEMTVARLLAGRRAVPRMPCAANAGRGSPHRGRLAR